MGRNPAEKLIYKRYQLEKLSSARFVMTFIQRQFTPQTDLHQQTLGALPTMYDLKSEDLMEPGLPNEFHDLQPQLLSRTLSLTQYTKQEMFSVSDMNLYYDLEHLNWYKRPDWFLVVGVSRRYRGESSRSSYVLWDEQVSPIVVVEGNCPNPNETNGEKSIGNGNVSFTSCSNYRAVGVRSSRSSGLKLHF